MNKSDLKVGMIVELRNKRLYMIHELDGRLVLINASGWMDLEDYKENLLFFKEKLNKYDIVTVHKPDEPYQLVNLHWYDTPIIWKRDETLQK